MSAIFELFRDDAGCYRFHLKSAVGDVIARSDAYQTRAAAEDAIDSIRHSAATAFVNDTTQASVLEASLLDGG
jgi:hypothetical protein